VSVVHTLVEIGKKTFQFFSLRFVLVGEAENENDEGYLKSVLAEEVNVLPCLLNIITQILQKDKTKKMLVINSS